MQVLDFLLKKFTAPITESINVDVVIDIYERVGKKQRNVITKALIERFKLTLDAIGMLWPKEIDQQRLFITGGSGGVWPFAELDNITRDVDLFRLPFSLEHGRCIQCGRVSYGLITTLATRGVVRPGVHLIQQFVANDAPGLPRGFHDKCLQLMRCGYCESKVTTVEEGLRVAATHACAACDERFLMRITPVPLTFSRVRAFARLAL